MARWSLFRDRQNQVVGIDPRGPEALRSLILGGVLLAKPELGLEERLADVRAEINPRHGVPCRPELTVLLAPGLVHCREGFGIDGLLLGKAQGFPVLQDLGPSRGPSLLPLPLLPGGLRLPPLLLSLGTLSLRPCGL